MNPLQKWLNEAGESSNALERLKQQATDETAEARAAIDAVRKKYRPQIDALTKSNTVARQKLQEAIDAGQVPELGVETDDWKLVQVKRSNPMLENFDKVPDEMLLPVAQWIDWKKVDDYVREHNEPPAGFGLVTTYSPRVMVNQKVRVE